MAQNSHCEIRCSGYVILTVLIKAGQSHLGAYGFLQRNHAHTAFTSLVHQPRTPRVIVMSANKTSKSNNLYPKFCFNPCALCKNTQHRWTKLKRWRGGSSAGFPKQPCHQGTSFFKHHPMDVCWEPGQAGRGRRRLVPPDMEKESMWRKSCFATPRSPWWVSSYPVLQSV